MAEGKTAPGRGEDEVNAAKQPQNQQIKLRSFAQLYNLIDELGKGAFSVVYRCVQITTGMEFAAKIMNIRKMKPDDIKKIEKEAKICRLLKHPNIVQIHDAIKDDDLYVLIFDLITGGELFLEIVSRSAYSEVDASHCVGQILDAISYCHKQGVIHRDLKPENLLLASKTRGADIKVADFGLAQEVKEDEIAWFGFCGTPGYISPEVLKGQPYGRSVDMWAIGTILYILLVGYPPFFAEKDEKHFELVKAGKFVFNSPDWDSVSTKAKSLISSMLSMNPVERISAEEALKNPWITHAALVASSIHRSGTIENLKSFNARKKFKAAVLTTMIATSSRAALGKLNNAQSKIPVVQKNLENPTVISGSNVPIPARINDKSEKTERPNAAVRRQEIVQLTEKLLSAVNNGNYDVYMKMVVPYVTTFDPDASGELVQGIDFHKNQFQRIAKNQKVLSTKIMNPYVHLLGPDAACIAYTRITHYVDREMVKQLQHSEETRLWQKQNGVWLNIHVHRSKYLPELWTKSSSSISDRQKRRSYDKASNEPSNQNQPGVM